MAGTIVLEVACGRGGFAGWLAERSPAQLVATDFSPAAVEIAASQTRSDLSSFTIADVGHLPHPDGTFEVIVSCETIEHVEDPSRAVAELARVLRPGGRLLLTTPNYLSTMGLYRGYRRLVGRSFSEEAQPLNKLTILPRTLRWLRDAGLRPRVVDGAGHCLPFPGRPPIALPALDGPRPVLKWLARHPLVVATKL